MADAKRGDKTSGRPTFRKPSPEGVTEVVGQLGRGWSLAEQRNGSLMAVDGRQCRVSEDQGTTWRDGAPLPEGISGSIIRLQSGALAIYNEKQMWLSSDDGRTWGPDLPIAMLGVPYYATMVQLGSGRLLYPHRISYVGEHPDIAARGHTTVPEMDIGSVSYSDDEGRSWQLSCGHLMGWFDDEGEVNGRGGVTPFDEPSLAETHDGRVLCFARSTVGRIVFTYSSDGGKTWMAVRPTGLAASYSPPRLVRIPETGDLMCVWNQVSRAEIRAGYRRGRLSAAISDDSGRSWRNFKTLEVSAGMQDIDRVPPEYPLKHVGVKQSDRELLPGWAVFRYMNVCFARDRVYVMYVREWLEKAEQDPLVFEDQAPSVNKAMEQVLRIYPLDYFYQ